MVFAFRYFCCHNVNKTRVKLFRNNFFISFPGFVKNQAIQKKLFLDLSIMYLSIFQMFLISFSYFERKAFLIFFQINIYSFCKFPDFYMFFSSKIFHIIFAFFRIFFYSFIYPGA